MEKRKWVAREACHPSTREWERVLLSKTNHRVFVVTNLDDEWKSPATLHCHIPPIITELIPWPTDVG